MYEDDKDGSSAYSCHGKSCGKCFCITVLLILIIGMPFLVMYLLLKPKEMEIKVQKVDLDTFDVNVRLPSLRPNITVVLHMDMTVKNPNRASFKYENNTVYLYYHGEEAGFAPVPASELKARRTENVSTQLIIDADTVLASPYLMPDYRSGIIPLTSRSIVSGRINVWNIFKHRLISTSDCDIVLAVSNRSIVRYTCERSYKF